MSTIKKYLDVTALGALVDQIKNEDAKVLAAANKAAADLGKNYDAVGSAATAESNAKAYAKEYTDALANGAVKTNTESIATLNGDAETTGSVAKAIADAKAVIDADISAVDRKADAAQTAANTAQDEVDALETYVGTFTHETAQTVVEYIDAKTFGIATAGNLEALAGRVTDVEGKVSTIEGDYLKGADKTEVVGLITAEESRATGVESALDERLTAVEDDYLTSVDAEALQRAIDAVAGNYLKDSDKEELEGKISAKADQTALQAEIERATGVEASLQTQINTILNNPDAEGAINSINEFTQYVTDHGTIADGFRTDINKNKDDISAMDTAYKAADTAMSERIDGIDAAYKAADESLSGKIDELQTYAEGIEEATKDNESAIVGLTSAGEQLTARIDAIEKQLGDGEGSVSDLIAEAKQEAINTAAGDATSKANTAEANAKSYTDTEVGKDRERLTALEAIEHHTHSNKSELDLIASGDKAKWDTASAKAHEHGNKTVLDGITAENVTTWNTVTSKASQSDLDAAVARIATNEGAIATLNETVADKAEQDDLDAAVERIAANEGAIATLTSSLNSFTPITADEVNAMFA